jgi:hypothetical protein
MAGVLFTDLVGSTELMAKVGQGRFDELRRSHLGAAPVEGRRAAADYGRKLGVRVLAEREGPKARAGEGRIPTEAELRVGPVRFPGGRRVGGRGLRGPALGRFERLQ